MPKNSTAATNYSDRAYRQMLLLILNEKMTAGQKLIYNDLAQKLEMSKTPIISALGRLEQEGVVVLQPNRGYYVRQVTEDDFNQLTEVREALEIESVRRAIDRLDDRGIALLRERASEHGQKVDATGVKARFARDALFHFQIAELTGNLFLRKHLREAMLNLNLYYNQNGIRHSRFEATPAEHQLIIDALIARDKPAAEKAVVAHIRGDFHAASVKSEEVEY